jgi:hypothetical protein
VLLATVGVVLFGVIIRWFVRLHDHWRLPTGQDLQRAIRESFAFAPLRVEELLIVRAAGDEASGVLAAAHIVTWLIAKLSRVLASVGMIGDYIEKIPANRTRRTQCAVAGLFVIMAVFLQWYLNHANTMVGILWISVARWFALAAAIDFGSRIVPRFGQTGILPIFGQCALAVQCVAGVLILPTIIMLTLCSVPFGTDVAALSALFEFSVESSPPGSFNVSGTITNATGLSHSASYQDSELLSRIGAWIRCRMSHAAAL